MCKMYMFVYFFFNHLIILCLRTLAGFVVKSPNSSQVYISVEPSPIPAISTHAELTSKVRDSNKHANSVPKDIMFRIEANLVS